MAHIGNPNDEKGKHWWMCYAKVDEEYVVNNNLYDLAYVPIRGTTIQRKE